MLALLIQPAAIVAPFATHGLARAPAITMTVERTFCRASDLLQAGDRALAVDVVNVLGRWRTHAEWDTIGELVAMDKLFDRDGIPKRKLEPWSEMVDGRRMMGLTAEEKLSVSPARSPNRRAWCKRNRQAQRWWHNENVRLLRFSSPRLAASVGKTAAEMNAMEVDPLAANVVFDALARSQSGIVAKDECDARRASYEDAAGAFDADAFASDLTGARWTVVKSYAVYPGSLQLVGLITFVRADGYRAVLDYIERFASAMQDGP
eukprot:6066922-Prymnesium_polylepis.1